MSAALDVSAATALAAVLDAPDLAAAKAAARAGLDRINAEPQRWLMLKAAAYELGVLIKTARRRAKAGAGKMTPKGWAVDIDAAAAMGRRS